MARDNGSYWLLWINCPPPTFNQPEWDHLSPKSASDWSLSPCLPLELLIAKQPAVIDICHRATYTWILQSCDRILGYFSLKWFRFNRVVIYKWHHPSAFHRFSSPAFETTPRGSGLWVLFVDVQVKWWGGGPLQSLGPMLGREKRTALIWEFKLIVVSLCGVEGPRHSLKDL